MRLVISAFKTAKEKDFTGEDLLSARDKKTMQLSRNRNGNAPLGERGTAR